MKKMICCTLLAVVMSLTACQNAGNRSGDKDASVIPASSTSPAMKMEVEMVKSQGTLDTMPHVSSGGVMKMKAAEDAVMFSPRSSLLSPSVPEHTFVPLMPGFNTESYGYEQEQGFIAVQNDPLSTFSVDVDTASYSNVRRFLTMGKQPPVGAVRLEEMVNYFDYSYDGSTAHPVAIHTAVGNCPWQPNHQLVQIGIQAKDISPQDLPPSNLVFLIDISGSMQSPNKLGLLKKAMKMLVMQLGENDRVSIVVYAGADRIILRPTSCKSTKEIHTAIDSLISGGSTNGAGGIVAAYELARQGFMPGGNNRIILASDGDFNVGTTSVGELEKLIEMERASGVYLTVLGFGQGNYHDSTMEVLADKGNGNYAYIDSLLEAKKVLVAEMAGTLYTVAKDVKLQVEFNPQTVSSYRLLGYKNRRLTDEDFNNDRKDAGDMGAGHAVTALYEIMPLKVAGGDTRVDPLKYQGVRPLRQSTDILTVKVRYKVPKEEQSRLVSASLGREEAEQGVVSADFSFAAAVAAFAMKLERSRYVEGIDYPTILKLAKQGRGEDDNGYRAEFIKLVEQAELLESDL